MRSHTPGASTVAANFAPMGSSSDPSSSAGADAAAGSGSFAGSVALSAFGACACDARWPNGISLSLSDAMFSVLELAFSPTPSAGRECPLVLPPQTVRCEGLAVQDWNQCLVK